MRATAISIIFLSALTLTCCNSEAQEPTAQDSTGQDQDAAPPSDARPASDEEFKEDSEHRDVDAKMPRKSSPGDSDTSLVPPPPNPPKEKPKAN